jgi:hypothetical protein
VIHRPARSKSQILPDGNPHKIPRMVPTRIGHPLFSYPPFDNGNVIGHIRGPGPLSLLRATLRWIVPSNPESLLEKGVGLFWGKRLICPV